MILWTDLETTGLDKRNGAILEIAVVATDDDLVEIGEPFVSLVKPPAHALGLMDDFVIDMHTKSGLLDELYELSWKCRGARVRDDLREASDVAFLLESWVERLLDRAIPGADFDARKKLLRETPFAGSSVHFDRGFMEEGEFAAFARKFSHRHIDVSAYNEGARRWSTDRWVRRPGAGPDGKPVDVPHRAYADILQSIETGRYWRAELFAPPAPVFAGVGQAVPMGQST